MCICMCVCVFVEERERERESERERELERECKCLLGPALCIQKPLVFLLTTRTSMITALQVFTREFTFGLVCLQYLSIVHLIGRYCVLGAPFN